MSPINRRDPRWIQLREAAFSVVAKGENAKIRELKKRLEKENDPSEISALISAIDALSGYVTKGKEAREKRKKEKLEKMKSAEPEPADAPAEPEAAAAPAAALPIEADAEPYKCSDCMEMHTGPCPKNTQAPWPSANPSEAAAAGPSGGSQDKERGMNPCQGCGAMQYKLDEKNLCQDCAGESVTARDEQGGPESMPISREDFERAISELGGEEGVRAAAEELYEEMFGKLAPAGSDEDIMGRDLPDAQQKVLLICATLAMALGLSLAQSVEKLLSDTASSIATVEQALSGGNNSGDEVADKTEQPAHPTVLQNGISNAWLSPRTAFGGEEDGDDEDFSAKLLSDLMTAVAGTDYEASASEAAADFGPDAAMIGLYWYCSDNHGGQDSDEYKILSQLGDIYRPGPMANGPEADSAEKMAYDYFSSTEYLPHEESQDGPAGKSHGPNEDPAEASADDSSGAGGGAGSNTRDPNNGDPTRSW